ncbi:orexigenic neuropeptide QRFP [Orycteropus afer afer]|uniref:Orexigenic neuropeptide QRFP n=1 Tax=Orycteropus afer afer TaxID=1230840 RepID=A0A8B7A556_ORYAF|nr:orexigenic neuropeptide QRFP [Orycteropus afer afer]
MNPNPRGSPGGGLHGCKPFRQLRYYSAERQRQSNPGDFRRVMCLYSLSYLLLLSLGTCFPLVDRDEPGETMGGIRAEMRWAEMARGHRPNFVWGSSRQPRAPQPLALLVIAKELPSASFRFRFGRQDDGGEATSFLPADGEKASGPLGNLAEELNGYSRKKGGFSFRFGRR